MDTNIERWCGNKCTKLESRVAAVKVNLMIFNRRNRDTSRLQISRLKLTYSQVFRSQFSTPNQASDHVNVHCGSSLLSSASREWVLYGIVNTLIKVLPWTSSYPIPYHPVLAKLTAPSYPQMLRRGK